MAWANEFQRVTALLFVVALPPLLLFADIALRVLYSSRFLGASSFVGLFVAAEVVTLLSGTYQSLIIAGDRMLFHVIQNLAAQALLVATVATAMPRVGLAGAGLATLAAPLFLYATTLIFLRRAYDVRVSRDAAWMARIIARFTPEHLAALVRTGDFTEPKHAEYLLQTLLARQQKILARYFSVVSPIADLEVHGTELCGVDLGGHVPGRVCVPIPQDDYAVLELGNGAAKRPLKAHVAAGHLVGLER